MAQVVGRVFKYSRLEAGTVHHLMRPGNKRWVPQVENPVEDWRRVAQVEFKSVRACLAFMIAFEQSYEAWLRNKSARRSA